MKTNLLKTVILAVLITISGSLKAFTAVVSGAWSSATTWGGVAPGATVSNQDIIIPSGITVDLDMDVTFSGVLNSFTVNGYMNSSSGNKNITITAGAFAGSGSMNIHGLRFSGLLTTWSHTGTLFLDILRNSGSTLAVTSIINISDTLDLDGGSMILSSGSNLTMLNNSNARINNGSISTTGGVFNTGVPYDVWYVGTSKTTGLEMNTTSLNNLHINMNDTNQVITQGIAVAHTDGDFNMTTGRYDLNGNHLTIQGNLILGTGSLFTSTNAASILSIGGSGPVTSNLKFTAGATLNNLVLNRTLNATIGLSSPLSISGNLNLTNGTLMVNTNGSVTMNGGSTVSVGDGHINLAGGNFVGTASYNVAYTMHSQTSGVEISGSGLNNLSVGMLASTETLELDTDVVVNGNMNLLMGHLSLYGYDLTLNGTFNQVAAATIMGDSASSMTLNLTSAATTDTMYFGGNLLQRLMNLTLNIPASSTLLVANDLTILNNLNMMSGKLEITNANFHIAPAASITGYSDTKYIVTAGSGKLEMWVNSNSTSTLFPVGSVTNYAPAQIQQTSSGTSGMFHVRAMNGVYSQGLSGYNFATTDKVVNKTWDIDAANGVTVNSNIILGWVTADEVNGFDRTTSYVSRYSSAWDNYTSNAAASGANNTYESTRNAVTSLGQFAVVDASTPLAIEPIVRAGINIYPNPTIDNLTIETGDVHGNYLYEIYDATGKIVYSEINSNAVNRIDVRSFVNGFYFIRVTDTDSHVAITKRIVKD